MSYGRQSFKPFFFDFAFLVDRGAQNRLLKTQIQNKAIASSGYLDIMEKVAEPAISDYALIGNSRSAALVSNTGSLDWCCLPEFDSPAIFAALLDREKGGCFSITPVSEFDSRQQYLHDTNVLETIFTSEEGVVKVTDVFTLMREEEKKRQLIPEHEILRKNNRDFCYDRLLFLFTLIPLVSMSTFQFPQMIHTIYTF